MPGLRLAVVYPEIAVLVPVLTPLCRHVGYLCAGRTPVQSPDELLQLFPLSLGFDFHPPVEQVSHSSAQAEPRCFLKHEPPEEHALNDTGDNSVK